MVIKNHDVFGAPTGGCRKTAGLVTVDGARDGHSFDEGAVCACRKVGSCRGVSASRWVVGLRAAHIFSVLSEMAFCGGHGLG
jgi:hypothetical protein